MKKWFKYLENKPEFGQWCYIIDPYGIRNIARYKYGFRNEKSYAWPQDKFETYPFNRFGYYIFGPDGCDDCCNEINPDPHYWIPIDSLDDIFNVPELPKELDK